MFQDLKNERTVFEADASRSRKRLKGNQPKNFSYPKKKIGKEERSFLPSWCDKWTWLHYDEAEASVAILHHLQKHRPLEHGEWRQSRKFFHQNRIFYLETYKKH